MNRVVKVLVVLFALVNVGWGIGALVSASWAAELVGVTIAKPEAAGEIRAVYGGLVGALGVAAVLALLRADGAGWLRALGTVFLGLVVGRVASLVADGFLSWTLIGLVFEGFGALLFFYAARRRETEVVELG